MYQVYYKKQNPNYEIKDILDINLESLIVSNVIIDERQKNKSSNLEQDLNDVCKNSNSTFENESVIEQTQHTISCSKQLTETNTFQKMNGFSKSETTSNIDNWSANVNTKVTQKLVVRLVYHLLQKEKLKLELKLVADIRGEDQKLIL